MLAWQQEDQTSPTFYPSSYHDRSGPPSSSDIPASTQSTLRSPIMDETTTISDMRRRRFARLPREIQLIILRHVFEPDPHTYLTYLSATPGIYYYESGPMGAVRERLKPLRLINRLFHDAVTPFIFASIHLHASELSLQRAENIANSRLAHHVREIVHYEGTFIRASKDKKLFLSILASHRRRRDYPKEYNFPPAEELYENYVEEIAASRQQDVFTVDRMNALLQKLPRCITFSTLRYDTEWSDPLTSAYTLRRTGLSYLPSPTEPTNPSSMCFVSAMTSWNPKVLNLTNFRSCAFSTFLSPLLNDGRPDSDPGAIHSWASQLTYLKLSWPEHPHAWTDHSVVVANNIRLLKGLFQSCHSLVHLELVRAFELFPDTVLFPENGLPKLTTLTLSSSNVDTTWAEETLFNCIKQLAPTLKHLHFQDISLERYTSQQRLKGVNGSLLRMLFNLTSCMNLESCTGLELIDDIKANVRMKQGFVLPGYKPGKAVIMKKVQEAVCGQRSWPEGFNMDSLPMDVTASSIHGLQNWELRVTPVTDEIAFIFSSWEDTVDPWGQEGVVEDGDQELKGFEELAVRPRLDEQRAEQMAPKKPFVSEATKISRSRWSRLSKVLGLK